MIRRDFWLKRIEDAWRSRPIVWLSGVRRVGKTSLAQMLPNAVYFNCDLPSTARALEDPEPFFQSRDEKSRIILDEVHRLPDPSNVLKIAADAYPHLRILATGSSTLAATRKFRDALTGRKWPVYLCPVLWDECRTAFRLPDLDRRLLHGGLPEQLLADRKSDEYFVEWMDSFYARDIAELFGLRDRSGFLALLRLLFVQSGGLADLTKLSSLSGLSRPTVKAHIDAMATAHAVFILRPFHGGGRQEIVRRPKIYAFDTGFVAFARGWASIREEDRGNLWEHLALDTLRAAGLESALGYWRDKSGREMDFVVRRAEGRVDAIESKINPDRADPDLFRHFRSLYPAGENWVLSPHINAPYVRRFGSLEVRFLSTQHILLMTETGSLG